MQKKKMKNQNNQMSFWTQKLLSFYSSPSYKRNKRYIS